MNVLTPRRRAILREIWRNRPSLRELARATGYAGKGSVHFPLGVLRRDGYLTWTDGQARTLTLTDKGLLAAQGWQEIYRVADDGELMLA
jgi:predicted transcriptional regulator